MGTTLQAVVEPVYSIIHTDREVQIEWREEIGINLLIITLVTMGKLRLADQLDGIIPLLGSLQTQLAGVSDQVVSSLSTYEQYRPWKSDSPVASPACCPTSPSACCCSWPAWLRVPAANSCSHHPYTSCQTHSSAGTADSNHRLKVQKLGRVMTISIGAASTSIAFGATCSTMSRMVLLRFGSAHDRCPHLFKIDSVALHQVGTLEINIHQGLVEHHVQANRLTPPSRLETQEMRWQDQ